MTSYQSIRHMMAAIIFSAKIIQDGGMTPRLIREAVDETDQLMAALKPPEPPQAKADGEPPLF